MMDQPGFDIHKAADLGLEGKKGVVFGATGGLGSAIVRKFVGLGADVFAQGAHNEQSLAELLLEQSVVGRLADITNPDEVSAMAVEVSDWCEGALDFVVYCAGVNPSAHVVREISDDDWSFTIAVNLTGAFNAAKAMLPLLKRSSHPKFVVVSSIFGIESPANRGAYGASKHGIVGLVQSLAREEGDWLHINALCPGPAWGDNVRRIFVRHAEERGITLEEYVKERVAKIPAGRFLEPEEFARVVAIFCSPFTDYINGQFVKVTGGASE